MPFRSRVSPAVNTSKAMGTTSGRSHTSHSTNSSYSPLAASAPSMSQQQVDDLAEALQQSVEIESRKCKQTRKKYKKCFVGSQAVDVLMELSGMPSRKQALEVGRMLQTSLNLFECANVPRVYYLQDDERLFYQFTKDTSQAKKSKSKDKAKADVAVEKYKDIPNLDEKMRKFQRGVRLKDRFLPYYYTTYKNCFVGREAVDFMMRHKFAKTRAECVEIGRILANRYNLFVPVTGNHDFEDDIFKFYRLLLPRKEQEKAKSFLEEVKPARYLIAVSLVPACLAYYYFY